MAPPHLPRRKSPEEEPSELRDPGARLRPAEGDQVALSVIDEGCRRLSAHERGEVARRSGRFEHRNLRELRQALALALEVGGIAEREHVVAPVHAEVVVDEDAAILRFRHVEGGDEWIHFHAARPDDGATAELRAIFRVDCAGSDLRNGRIEENAHALLLEALHRDPREARVHAGDDAIGAVEEVDRDIRVKVDRRVDAPKSVVHEVTQRARELDPDGPGADDDERELLAPTRDVGLGRRRFEDVEHVALQGFRVRQPFHGKRVLAHARDAVIVRHRAEHDHEMVERKLAVGRADSTMLEIDRRHLALYELEACGRGRVAQWIGDGVRWKLSRAHLIEQWREEVVVLAVDESDRRLLTMETALEPADEVESRKAAAEHHDALGRTQFALPDAASTRSSSARYARVRGSSASIVLAMRSRSRAAPRSPARRCAKPASAM